MEYDMMYDDIDEELMQAYLNGEPLDPELEDLLAAYHNDYGNGMYNEEFSSIPITELVTSCVLPTLGQAIQTLILLCAFCFIFKIVTFMSRPGDTGVPHWFLHISSAFLGVIALHLVFSNTIVYILICSAIAYFVMAAMANYNKSYCGASVSCFIVLYILACELYLVEETAWHSVRGAQIILSMKVIGLAFDVATGAVVLPSMDEYLGYTLCVGTVIFGPWSLRWVFKVVRGMVLGLGCMVVSTCLSHWLILDNSHKWVLAYRDAQSFRFSHYFVSFVSEATATLTGHGFLQTEDGNSQWLSEVSKPQHIEIPRSLVEVVTYWNLPMHYWLKTYVFKPARVLGTFGAVLVTYAASSLLHGLNFQLAAVLFSLGFYSYVEFMLRDKLSHIFDACVQAKSCKENCSHHYKYRNPYVFMVNLGFGALTMFHLAYLGLMFDNSSDQEKGYTMQHTLHKWANLNFASHWVTVGTYIFHLLI